ncbi:UNVERIFIED_CONTAM: hypothetical protein Slati_4403500 [Sesamum latifolium]|uniref:Retrotransposon gag domain-containing protein n=1 Tax=Sesamum latifolium TaxID=2727402 RepID=A0AAW2SPN8_9LAMI
MENPNQTTDKQKVVASPISIQALQVIAGAPPPLGRQGPPLLPYLRHLCLQKSWALQLTPPRSKHVFDTSTEELSPALLGAIQQIIAAALREHVPIAAPPRLTPPPEANVPEEEVEEEAPVPVPPIGRMREIPLPGPQEVPPQWLARLEHLQKGLQDVKYRIEGAPEDEQQGVPFAETVMADELPLNCCTPAIAEYDGTTDPMEHLSRFENAALLHRYTDGIKCRVFVTTFARAAQQWFNQLPVGAIGSFQEFRSLFLHQFASSRKLRKTELSLFTVRQKDDEPLKEYLQRFNAAALESLAKKPVSKFDALLARVAKYINMEEAQAAKRDSRGEKRKEIKEEAPSKKPRVDTQDRKPLFQRKGSSKTDICRNTYVGKKPEVLVLIKKEGDRAREIRTSSPERPPGRETSKPQEVREAHHVSIKEVLDIETMEDTPLIQFGRAERSGPPITHNDALVIVVILANYEVGRIFIDSRSSADILFGDAYDQMQLGDVCLERVNTSLCGFAGEVVHPRGMVSLLLTMGRGTTQDLFAKIPSDQVPNTRGSGRSTKRSSPIQKVLRRAVRKGQKRNVDDTPDKAPPSKKEKAPEKKTSEETETPAKVQPAEELLNIDIIPGSPDKTTQIGSHLGEEAKKEITLCLRRNEDIFAWTPQDLEGIDPQVITHHLNIDPS